MPDRNDHYVPEKRNFRTGTVEPITTEDADKFAIVTEGMAGGGRMKTKRPVAHALADELNRDGNTWWWIDYSDTTEDGKPHWSRFDGYHIVVDVDIRQNNERVVNDWKGRDEVRGHTYAKVFFNGEPVWEVGRGDIQGILQNLQNDIPKLLELGPLTSHLEHSSPEREAQFGLIGRKVYYHSHPGIITSFIGEQGCVIIESEDGPWPTPVWDLDKDLDYERSEPAKDLILSPHIWWWRD